MLYSNLKTSCIIKIHVLIIIFLSLANEVYSQTPDDPWPGKNLGSLTCPYNNTWTDATQSSNNDCGYYSTGGDHIYQFTTAIQSDVTIDLCGAGTDFDTYLLLYNLSDGNCSGAPLGSNDDACGTQSTLTQIGLAAGTYVIVIEGYGGATGNYDLTINISNCLSPMSSLSSTTTQNQTSTTYASSLASESREIKKPSESCIFEFDKKLHKYGTLQAKQK